MSQKIVDFEKWCKSCVHKDDPEMSEPCNTCLDNPTNEDSRRPVNWEENDKVKGAKDAVRKQKD